MLSAMDPFPVLRITKDDLIPEGSFAEAQAAFLKPDPAVVAELNELLRSKKIGVVAHFYMDPELQGVLAGCDWEHIGVSDSLKMADRGGEMVEAGCESIVVLGVDFMSENARAMLDAAGHDEVPVYRVAVDEIGSLGGQTEHRVLGVVERVHSIGPVRTAVLEVAPENELEELGWQLVVLLVRLLRYQRDGAAP